MVDTPNDAATVSAEPARGLRRPYVHAGLTKLVAGIDAYLSDEFTRGIGSSIAKIVEAEAPIEKGLLFNEVCSSYGTDSGAIDILRKNESLLKGIPHKETRYGGSVFVWRADQDPERYLEYRVSEGDGPGRFIGRVAFEELAALLYDVVVRESPLDADLLVDIAIDESGYSGPRSKSRRALLDVFEATCRLGLLAVDGQGDVFVARDLDDIAANGTGSSSVSPITVVSGQVKHAAAPLEARPSENRAFDARAASIRLATGEEAQSEPAARSLSDRYLAENAGKKKATAKLTGEKRARKSSSVKSSGKPMPKLNLGEEQGVLSNVGDVKLYVPDAPAGSDSLMERYMDPATMSRLVGGTVQHQKFGTGRIKKIEGNRVIMAFGGELKQFAYPTVLVNGIVVLTDREV